MHDPFIDGLVKNPAEESCRNHFIIELQRGKINARWFLAYAQANQDIRTGSYARRQNYKNLAAIIGRRDTGAAEFAGDVVLDALKRDGIGHETWLLFLAALEAKTKFKEDGLKEYVSEVAKQRFITAQPDDLSPWSIVRAIIRRQPELKAAIKDAARLSDDTPGNEFMDRLLLSPDNQRHNEAYFGVALALGNVYPDWLAAFAVRNGQEGIKGPWRGYERIREAIEAEPRFAKEPQIAEAVANAIVDPSHGGQKELFETLEEAGGVTGPWLAGLATKNESRNAAGNHPYEACVTLINQALAGNPSFASDFPRGKVISSLVRGANPAATARAGA